MGMTSGDTACATTKPWRRLSKRTPAAAAPASKRQITITRTISSAPEDEAAFLDAPEEK